MIPLTIRQNEILNMIATGACDKEIARDLKLSVWTVKDYCKVLFAKLHARNRSHAVARGFQLGILE
jgi:two-component system response regulator DesR